MFLILPKTWTNLFNFLKFDEGYRNSQRILVHLKAVTILPLGSLDFAIRAKKYGKIVSAKFLPLMAT